MSEILVDNLTGKTSAGDITVTSEGGAATMQLQQGLAKAWVYTSSAGLALASNNVASFTDHGVGDWQYNFTNSMSSSAFPAPSTAASGGYREVVDYIVRKSTASMGSAVGDAAGNVQADNAVSQIALGDLA